MRGREYGITLSNCIWHRKERHRQKRRESKSRVRISGRHYSNTPLYVPPVDYRRLQLQLFTLEASYNFTKDSYRAAYPRLNIFRDARFIVFAKCINVINSVHFAINGLERATLSDEWWKRMSSYYTAIKPNPNFRKTPSLVQYDTFIRTGFSIQSFSAIKGSFRDFVRALLPDISPTQMVDFKKVYDKLLDYLKIEGDYSQLLDVYRLVRNTLHNGVYFNPWNPDRGESIPYRGRMYHFIPYEPVNFADWEFVLMLIRDTRWLLFELVNHRDLVSKVEIVDSVGVKLESVYRQLLSNNGF